MLSFSTVSFFFGMLLAGQAIAETGAIPVHSTSFDTSTTILRRDGQVAPSLSSELAKGHPYVTFALSNQDGAEVDSFVLENRGCILLHNGNKEGDSKFPIGWGKNATGTKNLNTWRRDCQTFILNPLWREDWFWIQVSNSSVYHSWSQQHDSSGAYVSDANPLWELDQQFSIECKEVRPGDPAFYAKGCQIVQLSKTRNVDACLFAIGVLDPAVNPKGDHVRGGPCDVDKQGYDASRFDLMRREHDIPR